MLTAVENIFDESWRAAWFDKETGMDDHGRTPGAGAKSKKDADFEFSGNHTVTFSNGRTTSIFHDKASGHWYSNEKSLSNAKTPYTSHFSKIWANSKGMLMARLDAHLNHNRSVEQVMSHDFAPKDKKGFYLQSLAKGGFKFDASNPAAVSWADKHAAETIDGISETTRDEIRDLVSESLEGEYDVADLASQIADLLGDESRAELIARTESMRAANEGQQQLWDQAQSEGLLGPNAKQEWIVGDDEKLCPICQDMDGEQVGLDETFDVDGEDLDGPPAHPNCRCTVALVP